MRLGDFLLFGILAIAITGAFSFGSAGHSGTEFLAARLCVVVAALAAEGAYFNWRRERKPALAESLIFTVLAIIAVFLLAPGLIQWVDFREAGSAETKAVRPEWFTRTPVVVIFLVLTATAIAFWKQPAPVRLARWLLFRWRLALDEAVWLNHVAAINLVSGSRYARFRRSQSARPYEGWEALTSGLFNPPGKTISKDRMYLDWCELVLESFKRSYPHETRLSEDVLQYNEAPLRGFLDERYQNEIVTLFGTP